MRVEKFYTVENPVIIRNKLVKWAGKFPVFCFLNSNRLSKKEDHYSDFDIILGAGIRDYIKPTPGQSFESLEHFFNEKKDWIFGYFSYDLKNETEDLESNHQDRIGFPSIHFFQPELVITLTGNKLKIYFLPDHNADPDAVFREVTETTSGEIYLNNTINGLSEKYTRQQYIEKVDRIKNHIHKGDVYEINFCHEYYAEDVDISPVSVYLKLNDHSPAPFSGFYKLSDKYLICSSPERFLKYDGNYVISQPIKGTRKRGENNTEDKRLSEELRNDPKERAENIMIVDLVRNDLAKIADKDSVEVEELCGIYTFAQVHQMISTVKAKLRSGIHPVQIIRQVFPMGSMTGAPKVKAMELIEKYEDTKRGLYSGSVGYFTPEGHFDFNVVIRSLLYNMSGKYISYMAGSAITALSEPENEYNECMLKAKAIFEVLLDRPNQ